MIVLSILNETIKAVGELHYRIEISGQFGKDAELLLSELNVIKSTLESLKEFNLNKCNITKAVENMKETITECSEFLNKLENQSRAKKVTKARTIEAEFRKLLKELHRQTDSLSLALLPHHVQITTKIKEQTDEIMTAVKVGIEDLRKEYKQQMEAAQNEMKKKADKESYNGRYKPCGALTVGLLHLSLGVLSVSFGIAICVWIAGAATVIPLWAGSFYLVTGIFGILSSRKEEEPRRVKTGMIVLFMVMSIVSSIFAALQTFLQFRIVYLWFCCRKYMDPPAVVYFCIFAAIFGLAEFITSVISASLCCKGTIACKCCWTCCVCCCGPPAVKMVEVAVSEDNTAKEDIAGYGGDMILQGETELPEHTADNPVYIADESDESRRASGSRVWQTSSLTSSAFNF